MRSGGVAGAADISYILTSRNLLSGSDLDLAEMAVYGLDISAVVYDNAFAKAAVPSGCCYCSCLAGIDFGSCREGYIKSLMIGRADSSGGASRTEVR